MTTNHLSLVATPMGLFDMEFETHQQDMEWFVAENVRTPEPEYDWNTQPQAFIRIDPLGPHVVHVLEFFQNR
jgi:hypothetical protein